LGASFRYSPLGWDPGLADKLEKLFRYKHSSIFGFFAIGEDTLVLVLSKSFQTSLIFVS
jgi:hypothetical protein